MYLMMSNTCYGNNAVFNENIIDNGLESGITCFRRGSMSTAGTLTDPDGNRVNCGNIDNPVLCESGSRSLTLDTQGNGVRNGMYTCCIDGLCTLVL